MPPRTCHRGTPFRGPVSPDPWQDDLYWEVLDAHDLIRRTFDICRSDWLGRRIDLVSELRATRRHLQADPAGLQQVFWNLIKYAVNFTPDGGTVAVRTRDGADGLFVFEVADTGIGIEPKAL